MGDMLRPFTVASLAERWECSTHAVYALIRDKRLPAFRVGGKLLRIRAEDVQTWESAGGNTVLENTGLEPSTGKPSSAGKTRKALTAEDLASALFGKNASLSRNGKSQAKTMVGGEVVETPTFSV